MCLPKDGQTIFQALIVFRQSPPRVPGSPKGVGFSGELTPNNAERQRKVRPAAKELETAEAKSAARWTCLSDSDP
jgi:hypothetical protein